MFEVRSETGAIQYDVASHAFVFVGKGSFTATDHWTGPPNIIGSQKTGTYGSTVTGYDFDLVFFRCEDAFFLPSNRPFVGEDPRTIRVVTQDCWPPSYPGIYRYPNDYKTGLASHTIEYWCFRSMRHFEPSAAGCGVQLLNADGTLCFESNLDPIRVTHYKATGGDASTSAPGTPQALANPATTALMRVGTSALASLSGVSPNYRTVWYNEAVKNTATGYSRKQFSAFFQHKSEITGTVAGSSISAGGIVGVDISKF
ncbi:MAG: hypothetical protein V4808_07250 [Pseudomonadota bacterium]